MQGQWEEFPIDMPPKGPFEWGELDIKHCMLFHHAVDFFQEFFCLGNVLNDVGKQDDIKVFIGKWHLASVSLDKPDGCLVLEGGKLCGLDSLCAKFQSCYLKAFFGKKDAVASSVAADVEKLFVMGEEKGFEQCVRCCCPCHLKLNIVG